MTPDEMFEDMMHKVSGITRPVMEAQYMELRARFEAATKAPETRLQPGDFVKMKHGLGEVKGDSRDVCALIFWRRLDYNDWYDQRAIESWFEQVHPAVERIDCVVGMLSNDGAAIGSILTSSRFLEPDPAMPREKITPASTDGWIEWKGGECPVEESTHVDVRYPDGAESLSKAAAIFRWDHKNNNGDIVAYRIIF